MSYPNGLINDIEKFLKFIFLIYFVINILIGYESRIFNVLFFKKIDVVLFFIIFFHFCFVFFFSLILYFFNFYFLIFFDLILLS
jgi:hypothetical protein